MKLPVSCSAIDRSEISSVPLRAATDDGADWEPQGSWVVLRSGGSRWNDRTQRSILHGPFPAHVQARKEEQVGLLLHV